MLLYLNQRTFVGSVGASLADEVRRWRQCNLPILMLHENDPAKYGCDFGHFFKTTPEDLIADGLYRKLAIAFLTEPHREVSLCLAAKALGAEVGSGSKYSVYKFNHYLEAIGSQRSGSIGSMLSKRMMSTHRGHARTQTFPISHSRQAHDQEQSPALPVPDPAPALESETDHLAVAVPSAGTLDTPSASAPAPPSPPDNEPDNETEADVLGDDERTGDHLADMLARPSVSTWRPASAHESTSKVTPSVTITV